MHEVVSSTTRNVTIFVKRMNCSAHRLAYRQTGAFSDIILDYLDNHSSVRQFFQYAPSLEGVKQMIADRSNFSTNRKVLVNHLRQQYQSVELTEKVSHNIESLLQPHTFTITTAHQPNLFTGPLYFVYKILHAIQLAEQLKKQLPEYNFVPVYYMGNEDADFDELSHCTINGVRYQWATQQSGAFGRLVIDQEITRLIEAISGQLSVQPHGKEIVDALRNCFQERRTIQEATFSFVHFLFHQYGLVVLIPDSKELKQLMIPVFEEEVLQHCSAQLVQQTISQLKNHYKVQAASREINLFYLDEDLRERIEAVDDGYRVVNTDIRFTKDELLSELQMHPERFSPNVILRGLYQETILPNLAFVGGGGELAYWLELKSVFEHFKVPYPLLILRNSFLITDAKQEVKVTQLGFTMADLFQPQEQLLNQYVKRFSANQLELQAQKIELSQLYETMKQQSAAVDNTLVSHVDALQQQALKRIIELEKKLLRAEKRKFGEQQVQILKLKQSLFPGNGLQERKESILGFYARYGRNIIDQLYQQSLSLEQEFVILVCD